MTDNTNPTNEGQQPSKQPEKGNKQQQKPNTTRKADMNAKKQKQQPQKKPKVIPHRDHYARISYLAQASQLMGDTNEGLSRCYTNTMSTVAKKTVLRLSPHLKRTVCKKCSRKLTPTNCDIELENLSKSQSVKADVLVYTCKCGTAKRFPVGKKKDYKLWADTASAN